MPTIPRCRCWRRARPGPAGYGRWCVTTGRSVAPTHRRPPISTPTTAAACILFAPIAALGAVLLTDPSLVAPMFTGLFMEKMVGFLKLYFPVFQFGRAHV